MKDAHDGPQANSWRRARAALERHGPTIIAGEVSISAALITFVFAEPGVAVIVTIIGIIGTGIVGVVSTEQEHRERVLVGAQLAPVRASGSRQVANAASQLIRHAIDYRDAYATQPRRYTTLRALADGAIPEAGWHPDEAKRLYEGVEERARLFNGEVGAGAGGLDVKHRLLVLEISELLLRALDDLNTVEHAANQVFDGERLGLDDQLARGQALLAESTQRLRLHLQDVVIRAETLIAAGAPRAFQN